MLYLWLKTAHVTAMIVWIGGMLAVPLIAALLDRHRASLVVRRALKATFTRWVTPAMVLTLAVGVGLAQWGGWFSDLWLLTKLVIAIVLAGLHGVVSGRLRRYAASEQATLPNWLPWLSAATLFLVMAAVALALQKAQLL